MTVTDSKQNSRNLLSRFKRGQAWKEYAGYHVGDIHESQPIAIPHGSTVVGNVLAPQDVSDEISQDDGDEINANLNAHGTAAIRIEF